MQTFCSSGPILHLISDHLIWSVLSSISYSVFLGEGLSALRGCVCMELSVQQLEKESICPPQQQLE